MIYVYVITEKELVHCNNVDTKIILVCGDEKTAKKEVNKLKRYAKKNKLSYFYDYEPVEIA